MDARAAYWFLLGEYLTKPTKFSGLYMSSSTQKKETEEGQVVSFSEPLWKRKTNGSWEWILLLLAFKEARLSAGKVINCLRWFGIFRIFGADKTIFQLNCKPQARTPGEDNDGLYVIYIWKNHVNVNRSGGARFSEIIKIQMFNSR